MTDHLPECLHDDATYGLHGLCICTEIERAIDRVLNLNAVALGVLIAQRARERALDAAREAVVERSMTSLGPAMQGSEWVHTPSVLAAIDALRTKP